MMKRPVLQPNGEPDRPDVHVTQEKADPDVSLLYVD